MYISKLVLFITLESIIGLLVIGGFLFHRSRLYRLLQKIYQLKQKKEAVVANQTLISQNKKLIAQLKEAQDNPSMGIEVPDDFAEEKSLQLDGDHHEQLSALGLAYKTVKQMLEQQPEMDEEQSQALNERIAHILNIPLNKDQDAKVRELEHQIDFLKNENQLIEQKNEHIERLEAQITQLKSIDATAVERAKAPRQGDFADEIYRMKCEKFDMLENINRMKLDIERLSSTSDNESLLETLQEQVAEQNNYIKQSDVVVSLLEKELEAANLLIEELEKQTDTSGSPKVENIEAIEKELKNLQALHKEQRINLDHLKEKVANPEEGADLEAVLESQQKDIDNIAQNFEDSERCIETLRGELRNAYDRIKILESQLAASEGRSKGSTNESADEGSVSNNEGSNAQADEELEELLKKLINDSQEMLTTIADLEEENTKLKSQLEAK